MEVLKQTRLYSNEYKLARHGKITNGKLNAIDKTNPILIASFANDSSKFSKIFPENSC